MTMKCFVLYTVLCNCCENISTTIVTTLMPLFFLLLLFIYFVLTCNRVQISMYLC